MFAKTVSAVRGDIVIVNPIHFSVRLGFLLVFVWHVYLLFVVGVAIVATAAAAENQTTYDVRG